MKCKVLLIPFFLGAAHSLPTSFDAAAKQAGMALLDRAKEMGETFQTAMADFLTSDEIEGFKNNMTRIAVDAAGDITNTTHLDGLAQEWADNLPASMMDKIAQLGDKLEAVETIAEDESRPQQRDTQKKCDFMQFLEDACGYLEPCFHDENICLSDP
ncbi:hypothetical protein PRZ48_012313 [Zasmidium cellare]|uniref:Uncharacterized protein n=1 Tax=Zasmidium cellare TaxID=395010 RepID=A0ABR0E5F6_ZASCE|nr:hypothetical protein PRZ48_012313 [Zasmidium cellare]